ncbi:MAG TPA: hypothetical protein PK822_08735 [Bacillota bacterium]|nr:hypothetical protein [Bacillota bacterium]
MSKAAFNRLMTHRVTIVKLKRDYTGKMASASEYYNVPAFVQYGRKLVVNREGEEVSASAIVFLRADTPLDPQHEHWEITQTAPYSRGKMQVISIDPIDDPRTGVTHHYEVSVR